MKKSFKLQIEGRHPDRLLEAIKHEIRQYLKRERRKALPAGVDFWDFDCKFGSRQDTAEAAHVTNLTALIDALAQQGGDGFYLELIARPGLRQARLADHQGDAAAPVQFNG